MHPNSLFKYIFFVIFFTYLYGKKNSIKTVRRKSPPSELPLHCISVPVHELLWSCQNEVDLKHTLYRAGGANERQGKGEDSA